MDTVGVSHKDIPDSKRLWIGSLDVRITEYQLLKLLQKYGTIEKFDLLFHRSGPQAGQPRGYAFVTYKNVQEANNARESLNNMLLGQKRINVTWAVSQNKEEECKINENTIIPVLAIAKPETKSDRESQIQAIEAKLKIMEKVSNEELKINDTVATKARVIAQYQHQDSQKSNSSIKAKYGESRRTKPYNNKYNNKR